MLGIEAIEQTTGEARRRRAPPQPSLMDAVSGPINVTFPNPLQAKKEVTVLLRLYSLQFFRKTPRCLTPQPGDRPPGPFPRRPARVGKEPGGITHFAES